MTLNNEAASPSELIELLNLATASLAETVHGLAADKVPKRCVLPNWSRGHLLTHLANNAEGLTRLILGAQTDTELEMYSSAVARDSDIEAGAARPAMVIKAHALLASHTLASAISLVADWSTPAMFNTVSGPAQRPLSAVLSMRLREVSIHHVDLAAGHSFEDEHESVRIELIRDAARRFSGQLDHAIELLVDGTPVTTIASDEATGSYAPIAIDLPGAEMLGWLTGRDMPLDELPALPAWG